MPYFISDTAEGCDGWATVKDDGEVMGCHTTKQDAIDQGLAIAQAEGSTFEGERSIRDLPDNYRPATSDDVPEGRACGNCIFFNEDNLDDEGRAFCERWEEYVEGGNYCNAWEPREDRALDLSPSKLLSAIGRRAGVSAVGAGNMTPALWVEVRDVLQDGSDLWGVVLNERVKTKVLSEAVHMVGRLEEENEGRAKGEALSKLETRLFQVDGFEVREDADGMHLEGYAALFNSRSENLGGFTETIERGAFRKTLDSRNNVFLLYNHDTSAVLASRRAGTLTLVEDERGLKISASIAPTSTGRDVAVLVKRGDLQGFSFGFSMPARGGDQWNAEGTERVLKSVRLHEVSLTPMPAYTATNGTATVRGLDKIAQRANVDADALADALLKIENGEDISSDDRNLLQTVIDELAPAPEVPVKDNSLEMLALKKKKLQLLMES